MSDEPKPADFAGCFVAIWALLVTAPMWLVLLFSLMNSTDQPVWAWVLYWVYVPTHFLGVFLVQVAKRLFDES